MFSFDVYIVSIKIYNGLDWDNTFNGTLISMIYVDDGTMLGRKLDDFIRFKKI